MTESFDNDAMPAGLLLRQCVSFPYGNAARRGGLVRDRLLLVELDRGAVFLLRVPCDWHATHERMTLLARALSSMDGLRHEWNGLASAISWELETDVELREIDLAAPMATVWPLRAAAVERCRNFAQSGGETGLAERADAMTRALSAELEEKLARFTAKLDQRVLGLAHLWGGMSSSRYNWFVTAQGKQREYRVQAAVVSPALLGVLSEGSRPPDRNQGALSKAIDCGHPLIDALVEIYGIPAPAARHFLRMPASLMAGERIRPVICALGRIPADLYPRTQADWKTMSHLLRMVLPALTGRPAGSDLNLSFLSGVAKGGWENAEVRLREVGAEAGSQLRAFVSAAQGALAWDLMCSGGWRPEDAQDAAFVTIEESLGTCGLLAMMRTVRTWPALLSAAQTELAERLGLLGGLIWPGILDKPFLHGFRSLEQLVTHEACVAAGRALSNCIASYAFACAQGQAHIFVIRNLQGRPRGALRLRFLPDGKRGGYRILVKECKGFGNAMIDAESEEAAGALRDWLKSSDGQEQIGAMERKRMELRAISDVEAMARIEFEPVLMSLGRVRVKSLRLDALREAALRKLKSRPFT